MAHSVAKTLLRLVACLPLVLLSQCDDPVKPPADGDSDGAAPVISMTAEAPPPAASASDQQPAEITVPEDSKRCVECHAKESPGIVSHWRDSAHALMDVACLDCHQAEEGEPDAWKHEGVVIATIVTPLDCAECHETEQEEFAASHHSRAGEILHSLDNRLAEVTEGYRGQFSPHSPTPGRPGIDMANGFASANSGCKQCHGSKIALAGTDGSRITVDELAPDENGMPTNAEAAAKIKRDQNGKPVLLSGDWPNTGIGRFNLDGSAGACTACHSRHDFSSRRARQPENCGKCHLGPDHPQKEVYEESKHGIAYRDLKDQLALDGDDWVLGVDYDAAPTCATCHMSGNSRNDGTITHDAGERISWTNRPPVSAAMDTINGSVVKETDPLKRRKLIQAAKADGSFDSAAAKRERMTQVCLNCHAPSYVDAFYEQYDDYLVLYNEKFAKPGLKIMKALWAEGVITKPQFDDEIEWTWFYLWHHEGRRGRHGASMMAPDYAHWHGMYEVAERFYMELLPQARHACEESAARGNDAGAEKVLALIEEILARPEHEWFDAEKAAAEGFDHYQ